MSENPGPRMPSDWAFAIMGIVLVIGVPILIVTLIVLFP
jgi:hypothetical protein